MKIVYWINAGISAESIDRFGRCWATKKLWNFLETQLNLVLLRVIKNNTLLDRQWGRKRTMVEYQSVDICLLHVRATAHHHKHVSMHRITPTGPHNSSRKPAGEFGSRRAEDPSEYRERDVVFRRPEQRRWHHRSIPDRRHFERSKIVSMEWRPSRSKCHRICTVGRCEWNHSYVRRRSIEYIAVVSFHSNVIRWCQNKHLVHQSEENADSHRPSSVRKHLSSDGHICYASAQRSNRADVDVPPIRSSRHVERERRRSPKFERSRVSIGCWTSLTRLERSSSIEGDSFDQHRTFPLSLRLNQRWRYWRFRRD